MIEIRLREPVVRENAVDFSWTVTPEHDFYRANHFTIEFPRSVEIGVVPEGVWLRAMLAFMYCHWAVLRPCRVVLPRRLPAGEREFWMRMVDTAVWALEIDQDEPGGPTYAERTRRNIEIVETGPPAGELTSAPAGKVVINSFSGGRDSLTQAAMLRELGLNPVLVTTESKREGSIEFETARFRKILDAAQERTGLELVEVTSDARTCVVNDHPLIARYELAVSELTDTLLYFAVCWATGWVRGASAVYLASEAEVQESIRRDGMIVQIVHVGFTGATQRALTALAAPTGVAYANLTESLQHFQIQRILDHRYPELSDLQYSCFSQKAGEDVCNDCFNCLKTALHKMSNGSAPSDISIDLNKVLAARSDWTPQDDGEKRNALGELFGARMNNHLVRVLRELDAERVAAFAPGGVLTPDARAGLEKLRATAFAEPDPPDEPGYRAGFLSLLDEPLRSGLDSIFSDHFGADSVEEYAHLLENSRLLSEWIAAPLAAGRL